MPSKALDVNESNKSYLPAAGLHLLLPLYDLLTKWMGMDRPRKRLVELAELRPDQRVLDIGCGTGTLAILIKRTVAGVKMTGADPDPRVLARARQKAARAGVPIQFERAFAGSLPYADSSFDQIFSSFMFHHLPLDEKKSMLREVVRVLKPGGHFFLLDFNGKGHGILARIAHSREVLQENSETRILELLRAAGLKRAHLIAEDHVLFGGIGYYGGQK